MSFGKKKTPTLEERLSSASAAKETALSVFASAAIDLEDAVFEADEVANTIDAEISRLRDLQYAANKTANEASAKATLIRQSFLG